MRYKFHGHIFEMQRYCRLEEIILSFTTFDSLVSVKTTMPMNFLVEFFTISQLGIFSQQLGMKGTF